MGPKLRATGAVHIERLEFLDSVLHIAALAIDFLLKPPYALFYVGDHEEGIIACFLATGFDHLGLDDDTPLALSIIGRIARVPVNMLSAIGQVGI